MHDHFEHDDGTLPEVQVTFSDGHATAEAFALLWELSTDAGVHIAVFCSIPSEESHPVSSVPNAAALVVSGEAEPFHCLLRGMERGGVRLPDIGVLVFPDQIALDYRMGDAWGPAEVRAFFRLLYEVARFDTQASVRLQEGMLPAVHERFDRCWSRFVAEQAA